MVDSCELHTPEEAAALRELAREHRRRHRLMALGMAVVTSIHGTLILATAWYTWPTDARSLGFLLFFVANGLFGLGLMLWSVLSRRQEDACEHRWRRRQVRWEVQCRAWPQAWEGRS